MMLNKNVAVEKVKRNLFGTPTDYEKQQFHEEYTKTFSEERKVKIL